ADYRLLAATNRNLEALVAAGTFRSDLYYRLDVVPLSVPPLRERREDIPELVEHFAGRVAAAEGLDRPGTTEDFLAALKGYLWPGNVRELENLVERLVVLYRPKVLEARLLEEEAPDRFGPMDPDARERTEILDALRRSGGNKSAAARSLGISRRALYYRMSRLGIEAGDAPGND
ncbi:MAG TPA: helix-turn-helix domain-containing protein, partial [Spirochaetia bacterium]|nr:helix-turn-helix domain-containing protein [Spirochaetia bacterium]